MRSSIHDVYRTWQVPFGTKTTTAMQAYIGCSGWHYRDWRGRFYPPGLPTSKWLSYYVERFRTVELNNTFYRMPTETAVANWAGQAPPDFLFAVKGSRYVTHTRRLRDCAESVGTFCETVRKLGTHLGPILWQLPPTLLRDDSLLTDFLAALPRDVSHTVEFRHGSWWGEPVYDLLRESGIAFCLYHMESTSTPVIATADFTYLRFHGPEIRYGGRYDSATLREWADGIRKNCAEISRAFVYFNNDIEAHAVANAEEFRTLLGSP